MTGPTTAAGPQPDTREDAHISLQEDRRLVLTKHHGSGNDFLVALQPDDVVIGVEVTRALCDRHRGLGADGLIVGVKGSDGADLAMTLRNADGSEAEMSGNGIRCLVQAAVAAGMAGPGTVVVDTAAGRRNVDYREVSEGLGYARVDMGPVRVGEDLSLEEPPGSLGGDRVSRVCRVGVGNPHVVLLGRDPGPDIRVIGPLIDHAVSGGANVEIVTVRSGSHAAGGPGEGAGGSIGIEVWERGVGVTESCGTGACAAAAAARSWGLAGDEVEVTSPGGQLQVRLGPESATLSGPVRVVGAVTVEGRLLDALVAERREGDFAAL